MLVRFLRAKPLQGIAKRWKLLFGLATAIPIAVMATALIAATMAGITIAVNSIAPWAVSWLKIQYYGKTKWDYLEKILIPVVPPMAIAFGVWFLDKNARSRERHREENENQERERIRTEEDKSRALQLYFERISTLLIEQQVVSLAKAAKKLAPEYHDPVVESARNVIRAQTLAILRIFSEDIEKKSSVMRFLVESEILGSLAVSLSGADLTKANLKNIDLIGADLKGCNLRDAILTRANFKGADLTRASLVNAEIFLTEFDDATLISADMRGVKHGINFTRANLLGAWLEGADLKNAFLNYAMLEGVHWDDKTIWPDQAFFFRGAEKIPDVLKQQLGL